MNRYYGTWSVSYRCAGKIGQYIGLPGRNADEAKSGARMLLAGFDARVIDAWQTPEYRQQIELIL